MIKSARTWHWGGGDNPLRSIRYYRFGWDEGFWGKWKRRPHLVELDCGFDIQYDVPKIKEATPRQSQDRHVKIMNSREFYVKDRNVLEWFDDMVQSGSAVIEFEIDSSAHNVIGGRPPVRRVAARFTDPGMAAMFKLAFGGK